MSCHSPDLKWVMVWWLPETPPWPSPASWCSTCSTPCRADRRKSRCWRSVSRQTGIYSLLWLPPSAVSCVSCTCRSFSGFSRRRVFILLTGYTWCVSRRPCCSCPSSASSSTVSQKTRPEFCPREGFGCPRNRQSRLGWTRFRSSLAATITSVYTWGMWVYSEWLRRCSYRSLCFINEFYSHLHRLQNVFSESARHCRLWHVSDAMVLCSVFFWIIFTECQFITVCFSTACRA